MDREGVDEPLSLAGAGPDVPVRRVLVSEEVVTQLMSQGETPSAAFRDAVDRGDADAFEDAALNNPANSNVNRAFTNTLQFLTGSSVGRIANGANESAVVAATSLGSISSFLTTVNYIGAFSGPNDTWTRDWTCNSDVADLRGALGCTDIRVF